MSTVDPNLKPNTYADRFRLKHKRVFILLVVVGALGLWAWWKLTSTSSRDGGRIDNSPPQTVTVAAARRGDMATTLSFLGTVIPNDTVVMTSRVDGQLNKIFFREGQRVKAGQLLAELDPRPFQIQLSQAEGQLMRDSALLNNAKQDLARYKMLQQQNSVAQQQVDTQQALVRQYQGTVKMDQGLVANAQLQLSYSRITAPISGQLGIRLVDVGNMIQAASPTGLVVITQMQPSFVQFSIPEKVLDQVLTPFMVGVPLVVEAWSADHCTHLASGLLTVIDNQVDSATGTIKLKAQFDNKDNKLFANRFVNVKLTIATWQGVTLVPAMAVQRGKPGTYVFVVKSDKTVTLRPVVVGPTDSTRAVIEKGLVPGEQVVLDGIDRLREGSRVRVAPYGSEVAKEEEAPPHQGCDNPSSAAYLTGKKGQRP